MGPRPALDKDRTGKRDPEMHHRKKDKEWYFGMKAHIGVDAHSGLLHTVIGAAGNISDITKAQALLTPMSRWHLAMLAIKALKSGRKVRRHRYKCFLRTPTDRLSAPRPQAALRADGRRTVRGGG